MRYMILALLLCGACSKNPIQCPDGTEHFRVDIPEGSFQTCVAPGKHRMGPYLTLTPDGRKYEEGTFDTYGYIDGLQTIYDPVTGQITTQAVVSHGKVIRYTIRNGAAVDPPIAEPVSERPYPERVVDPAPPAR